MSTTKNRIDTLEALVDGSVVGTNGHIRNQIIGELNEVNRLTRVSDARRRLLLQVLHATRALDSTLKAFTAHHRCPVTKPALGGYLTALTSHSIAGLGTLAQTEKNRYQKSIVKKRNRYMHEAGAYPINDKEIFRLLSEMETCLTRILSL